MVLGDENVKLEQENERVVQEMAKFRDEYKKKFKELKKVLGDQALPPPDSPPEKREVDPSDSKKPHHVETQSEKEARLLQRQQQLEQTIGGLLQKYYSVSVDRCCS